MNIYNKITLLIVNIRIYKFNNLFYLNIFNKLDYILNNITKYLNNIICINNKIIESIVFYR